MNQNNRRGDFGEQEIQIQVGQIIGLSWSWNSEDRNKGVGRWNDSENEENK